MIAAAFPYIILQIIGPLFVLILLASYCKEFILIFIAFSIFANFVFIRCVYFESKPFPDVEIELQPLKNNVLHNMKQSRNDQESQLIFDTAVFTSWISPCTVWSNSLTKQTRFLLASSSLCIFTHLVSLACIGIFLHFGSLNNNKLFPISHCHIHPSNATNLHFLIMTSTIIDIFTVCKSGAPCVSVQRLCSEDENPLDLFVTSVVPIAICLLLLSLLASVCLQLLGNYLVMYETFCCFDILHNSLVQDLIRQCKPGQSCKFQGGEDTIIDLISQNSFVKNQKDPLHGNTCMHEAVFSESFKLLNKMIDMKWNILIENNYGETVLEMIRKRSERGNSDYNFRFKLLLEKIKRGSTSIELIQKVWNIQPMHRSVQENNPMLLCFLSIIGGHWGTMNDDNQNVLNYLFSTSLFEEIKGLQAPNLLAKKYILTAIDRNEEDLLHEAAKLGEIETVKFLIRNKNRLSVRDSQGHTALHIAAKHGHWNVVSNLIANGAEIDEKDLKKKTALHHAAEFGRDECLWLLVQFGWEVNVVDLYGKTPYQYAKENKHDACVQILVNSGADAIAS